MNLADTMPNYFKQRQGLLIELLKTHEFNDKQRDNVCKFVIDNQIQLTDQDLIRIDNSIKFWNKYIDEKPTSSKDGSELIDHNYVLGLIEPSLLFIDCFEMKKRVTLVQKSGFVDSKQDMAKLFIAAPKGK